jgi:hypothetical protein
MNGKSPEDSATEKWADREEAHARHVIATAKVVVTFWAAIAAAFVATAIQDQGSKCMDGLAALCTALALILTAVVVGLPSRPQDAELEIEEISKPSDRITAASAAVKRADLLHVLTVIQVGLSILASTLAGLGLLFPG